VRSVSGILTKWVVLHEYPVDEELDRDGLVGDAAVERWVAAARSAYLQCCPLLERVRAASGLELTLRTRVPPRGALRGNPTGVVVTASATEVRPASFTISVRLRAFGGDDDTVVNATSVVSLTDPATGEAQPLGTDVRDELIALEHAARHYN
jgi:acyl-CoA thioesterase FadM